MRMLMPMLVPLSSPIVSLSIAKLFAFFAPIWNTTFCTKASCRWKGFSITCKERNYAIVRFWKNMNTWVTYTIKELSVWKQIAARSNFRKENSHFRRIQISTIPQTALNSQFDAGSNQVSVNISKKWIAWMHIFFNQRPVCTKPKAIVNRNVTQSSFLFVNQNTFWNKSK